MKNFLISIYQNNLESFINYTITHIVLFIWIPIYFKLSLFNVPL
jgi:hypothetical protein